MTDRGIDRRALLRGAAAAAGAAAAGAGAGSAPARAASGIHTTKLGPFEITVVSDGALELPMAFLLPKADKAEVDALLSKAGQDRAAAVAPLNVVLVKRGAETVMIDCGAGSGFVSTAGRMADALEKAGIATDSVTQLVFTHAHADHLWGVIDDLDEVRFAKAAHIISAAEWDYWIDPVTASKVPEAFQALAAGSLRRLKLLEDRFEKVKGGHRIADGITVLDTPGHTPGHQSILLEAGTDRLLIGGDVIGHPVLSFERPDWHWGTDWDAEMGAKTRRRTLDMLATDKIGLLGYHLPWPGLARVVREGHSYRMAAMEL